MTEGQARKVSQTSLREAMLTDVGRQMEVSGGSVAQPDLRAATTVFSCQHSAATGGEDCEATESLCQDLETRKVGFA